MEQENAWLIIPARNEEHNITEVVAKAKRFGKVLVVDDGSTDGTAGAAKEEGAVVLRHVINLGKGAALKTGCDYAVMKGAHSLVVLDADTQHDPEEIPNFLERLNSHDIVFGFRKFSQQMPAVFRIGNWGLSKVMSLLFGVSIADTQCGYRAFTAEAYKKVRWSSSSYSMETEMIANMGIQKLRYAQVPIKTIYADRYKGTTIFDGIKIICSMLWWRLTK
ncbi:glycosyltransferase family 2 protein [Candidatus Woesearchaeota archaeon]|nr:glycosyltransferase family 2 protein [Candidatus Woesearchaeota archaeon]